MTLSFSSPPSPSPIWDEIKLTKFCFKSGWVPSTPEQQNEEETILKIRILKEFLQDICVGSQKFTTLTICTWKSLINLNFFLVILITTKFLFLMSKFSCINESHDRQLRIEYVQQFINIILRTLSSIWLNYLFRYRQVFSNKTQLQRLTVCNWSKVYCFLVTETKFGKKLNPNLVKAKHLLT